MSDDLPAGGGPSTPEAIHGAARGSTRGRLKVFLGAYPGVGKTYAMLLAARECRARGVDVVVGAVETHGQADAEELLRTLDVVPRRKLADHGRFFGEMDVEAILARRPALVLVDEWAHVNAPGSRHHRRFEDVEELLAAGIDVYTALNVQHVESLNDVVARICRVRIRDTLPDPMVKAADEIELIDLPPDQLRKRLREGKVHVGDPIGNAIRYFFSEWNLVAFREMAMRFAAKPAAPLTLHPQDHAIPGGWQPETRLLVCVDAETGSDSVVHEGWRLAQALRADWIVFYVRTPRHDRLDEQAKDRVAATLRLGERLGAETMALPAKSSVAREIIDYASAHNVTHIVLGRSRGSPMHRLFSEPVASRVARRAKAFQVLVVSSEEENGPPARRRPVRMPATPLAWFDFAWATAGVAAATVAAAAVERTFSVSDLSFIFLTAVLLIASRLGVWPALYAGILSFLSVIFFFAPPYYSLWAVNQQDVFTLALFLFVATLTGNLAGRLRRQVDSIRVAALTTANLYELSRKIAAAGSLDDVLRAVVHHVASALECWSVILLPRDGKLDVAAGYPAECPLEPGDWEAAEDALRDGDMTGSNGGVFAATWQFRPLQTRRGGIGVLGLHFEDRSPLGPDTQRLVDAMTNQIAVAIERTLLMMDIEDARLLNETERLRAALLSSVSHDLKTPLVSIIGATTALSDTSLNLPDHARSSLIQAILDDAIRLHRFVQNLLDMTRLSYGALEINRRWCEMGEIVGSALRQTEKALSRHRLNIRLPADLPGVRVDPVLIEHVLINLLDNAAKYSPTDTVIEVTARIEAQNVLVAVTDDGSGIPESDREAVFDQFYRIRVADRQVAGTGLGLSICRGLVEAHGGKIAITSGRGGRGTCVTVTLPLEEGSALHDLHEEPASEGQER